LKQLLNNLNNQPNLCQSERSRRQKQKKL